MIYTKLVTNRTNLILKESEGDYHGKLEPHYCPSRWHSY